MPKRKGIIVHSILLVLMVIFGVLVLLFVHQIQKVINQPIEDQQPSLPTTQTINPTTTFPYHGKLIAGKNSLFIEFNQVDYQKATQEGKTIMLYFYAEWCPMCVRELQSVIIPTFNEYEKNSIIGFAVHYKDNRASVLEKKLAKEFGVVNQNTKVFIEKNKNPQLFPDQWTKEDYIQKFNFSDY